MKIRTTERNHTFTNRLFKRLNLFSVQGLTISKAREFTAAIEAVQYDPGEEVHLQAVFPDLEVKARYYLANLLNIPLYYLVYQEGQFRVYRITTDNTFHAAYQHTFDEKQFIAWWAHLKGMTQPKPLMEAAERVQQSVFDATLEKYGLAWGGNIDGFMFKNKALACIIENIYTQRHPLESRKGEPSYYFHMRGPNFNTWYPTVKLANQLEVPLFLFTIEGHSEKERIGFAVIDHLSKGGIYYRGEKPNRNILEGLDTIRPAVIQQLSSPKPYIA